RHDHVTDSFFRLRAFPSSILLLVFVRLLRYSYPFLLASFLPPPLPRLSPTVAALGRSPWGLVVVERTLAGYNLLAVYTDKVFSLLSPYVFSFVCCGWCA